MSLLVMNISAAEVESATEPLPEFDAVASVQNLLLGSYIEATSRLGRPLVSRTDIHPLAQAAYLAFTQRYPLALSPDIVWFCLARGLTLHLATNEDARQAVVDDDAQPFELTTGAVAPSQPAQWAQVIPSLSAQIAASTGDAFKLVSPHFATTGPIEKLAAELTTGTPLAPHYTWEPPFPGDAVYPDCGIPSIHLSGTVEDWQSLRDRAEDLEPLGLEAWLSALVRVLDQIVTSVEGRPDPAFWRAFFRYENGADEITGWIHVLFPYLVDFPSESFIRNPYLSDWQARWAAAETRTNVLSGLADPQGPGFRTLPPGLSSMALKVEKNPAPARAMDIVAGLIGVTQDPYTLALSPEFAWAIVREEPMLSAKSA